MPEINLVPMIDVLTTILTFFVVISMTLTAGQTVLNVNLPKTDKDGTSQQDPNAKQPEPMIVGINQAGEVVLQNKSVDFPQLQAQTKAYFGKFPLGNVVLKADRKTPYEKLAQVLEKVRQIGGDRIALAVDAE
jgi:biopolymer transport protein ExbD